MKKHLPLFFVLGIFCFGAGGCAEFKSAGKTIGHATRDAAKDIGHGTRRVVREATK